MNERENPDGLGSKKQLPEDVNKDLNEHQMERIRSMEFDLFNLGSQVITETEPSHNLTKYDREKL